MASVSESDDGAPRAKRPRRSDGSDDDALLPLPLTDPSYEEGCTRWREFEAVGGRFEAPRSPRCAKKASFMAKCACGAVICQRCDDAQEETGDVWKSCDGCARVYKCSRCLDEDDCALRSCDGGCDEIICDACRRSCEDCSKDLCESCGTDCDGNTYCEDCYDKMVARTQEYADEQRALQSEILGEDYQ